MQVTTKYRVILVVIDNDDRSTETYQNGSNCCDNVGSHVYLHMIEYRVEVKVRLDCGYGVGELCSVGRRAYEKVRDRCLLKGALSPRRELELFM